MPWFRTGLIHSQFILSHRDFRRQLMEQQSKHHQDPRESDEGGVEEFRILGKSMCVNRWRDGESWSAASLPSERVVVEPQCLDAHWSAIRAWGNQPLCVMDTDACGIMGKEKQRQFKGIDLMVMST